MRASMNRCGMALYEYREHREKLTFCGIYMKNASVKFIYCNGYKCHLFLTTSMEGFQKGAIQLQGVQWQ